MRADFHTHTFLSDGELHITEHLRYAHVTNHNAVAITDHVGVSDATRTIPLYKREFAALAQEFNLLALPGVELTHVPPKLIPKAAKAARRAGAVIVVVHGETPDEPVARGTNAAAVRCSDVDILAHPGFLTLEDAEQAAKHDVFLELTPRRVHCHANGHVARVAQATKAKMVVNSDAHAHSDLMGPEAAKRIAVGAGLDEATAEKALNAWPRELLKRAGAI